MAESGSARKNLLREFSAGATTSTSASSATSGPTAARRASADTGSETRARIRLGILGLISQSASRKADGERDLNGGERQFERPLRKGVREPDAEQHAERRQARHHEPVADADVPVAVLAPGPDERDRHDREQRRGLRAELRHAQEEHEPRHEQDASAHSEQA